MVTVFRELRNGVTVDGRTKVKQPSSTLSTAEAISVMTNGLTLAAHFGDGELRAEDIAASLVGAIVKDPVQDQVAWQEYLETVARERRGWSDLYHACRALTWAVRVFRVRHHGPGSARALAASSASWEPDGVDRRAPRSRAVLGLAASARMRPPVALLGYLPGPSR